MKFKRQSGILLHPTSLPSKYGIGDFGKEALEFIDFLVESGQKIWQILPLGPTGYGDSPYQSFSAFAGNHYLISIDKLIEDNLISDKDLEDIPDLPAHKVDYGTVIEWKVKILEKAYESFLNDASKKELSAMNRFSRDNNFWLDDYALFMSLKTAFDGKAWEEWDKDIAMYKPESVKEWTEKLSDKIAYHKWLQYTFSKQWSDVKFYANKKKIKIVGDLPIFISYDSADLWSNADLFQFSSIAGVPPDYFSSTGQMWGNPHYNWENMKRDDYYWWRMRFINLLRIFDIVRIDHFRGFEAAWHIPFGEETAVKGQWVKAPGEDFFNKLFQYLGEIPIIAEDLGVITKEVEKLRDMNNLPGMRILQFAFEDRDPENNFLPHNYSRNTVAYTGTHDNDTVVGWYNSVNEEIKEYVRRYLKSDGVNIHWDFIQTLLSSCADTSIIPLQDLLGLDSHARMNFPSSAGGNWQWRFTKDMITKDISERLHYLCKLYGR